MLDKLDLDSFKNHLNTSFKVSVEGDSVDLELIEATESGGETTPDSNRKPFSLLFRGPRGVNLEQQIYALDHPKAGKLEVFLVPVQPDDKGPCYEAVFT
jgi:hypothetical protein